MMLLLRLLLLPTVICIAAPGADSTGKFTIYMSGKPLAAEDYSIRTAGGKITFSGSGSADLGMLKINIERFEVVTDEKYSPLQASDKEQMGKANRAVTATFTGDTAKVEVDTGQGPQSKEERVHGGDIVINANLPVFPWSQLAARVRLDSTEPQQFYAYIMGQSEAPLTVTSKGKETVEFANKTATLNHIAGSMTLPSGQTVEAEFWIDDDRKIIKAAVPAQKIEVYQDGFDPKTPPAKVEGASEGKPVKNP